MRTSKNPARQRLSPVARCGAVAALACSLLGASGCLFPQASPSPGNTNQTTIATAREQLELLPERPEDTGYHYERDEWLEDWAYQGDGCDTRDLVLKRDAEELVPGKGCAVPGGRWVSVYDGQKVTDPSDLDIDHIVPLAEAARSGVREWSQADRESFANDRQGLVAVTASSNREKSDQDPASWLPPNEGYRCTYAAQWIAVKAKYELAIDTAEKQALTSLLDHC